MQIVSLQAGSLVVTLRLTLQDPDFSVGVHTLTPMLPVLSVSNVFQVDQQRTFVQGTSLRATGLGGGGRSILTAHKLLRQQQFELVFPLPESQIKV